MVDHAFDSQGIGRRINELLLLSILLEEPMHGYQAALEAEERSGGYFRFNHGTLYPILHRLEKDGLIAGEWDSEGGGRPRKAYSVTEAGRTYVDGLAGEWHALGRQLAPFLGKEAGNDPIQSGAA